jgi:hemoglobin
METEQPATASFYERIGGGPALQLAVGEFYELVVADEELKGFFAETDMAQLKKHQAALLASVLGGPSAYAGRDMVDAHAGLGITEHQFLLVRDYLVSVLWKLHVPVDIIDAVTSTVLSLKGSIVTA